MSGKEIDYNKVLWSAVRTGAASMLAALVLLLPVAWLVYTGTVKESSGKWGALAAVALGSFAAQRIVSRRWGGGGLIGAILGGVMFFLILLLLTAGLRNTQWDLGGMLPTVTAATLGMTVGALITFNKKYTKARPHKKRYNK